MVKLKFLAFKGYRRAGSRDTPTIIITKFCFLFPGGPGNLEPTSLDLL